MARKCKECPDGKIETKPMIVKSIKLTKGNKRYVFPKEWKVVIAKDLAEANELVKAMSEVEIETK